MPRKTKKELGQIDKRRLPKDKLPDEERSRTYTFRLDPKTDGWLIDMIEYHQSQGMNLRRLFTSMAAAVEGRDVPVSATQSMQADEFRAMMQEFRDLIDRVADGKLYADDAPKDKKGRRKAKEIEMPDALQSAFSMYMGGGITSQNGDDD